MAPIGGTGRELCWFPDPIGGRDCYRAALADAKEALKIKNWHAGALKLQKELSAAER